MASENQKITLVPATLMVAGNMMGSGVFMLPASLAATGSIALLGWCVTIAGAVALALVFAKLAAIDPAAGGPYAYTKKAFGNYMGYQTNLIYWLANVVGNVGLAVAGLGYLSHFFPVLKSVVPLAVAQIAIIWLFTYANILGPRFVSRLQAMTTMFALVPIMGTAIFGWFWFSADTYSAGWNVTGGSTLSAISATLTFTLWAFIGVESASVSAGVVENPQRNVPIATVGGVVLAAICYVLSSSVIMGMIPNKELVASNAPFADAARIALGDMGANVVAACAAIGCLGSLAGWTLLVGQTAKAAADDGLFAKVFAKVNAKGVPAAGLVIVAVIMSVQVLLTMSPTAGEQFSKIASIAVIMTLLPYIYSAISIKILGYKKMSAKQYSMYVFFGLVAALYSLWALVGSDGEQVRWSLIFVVSTMIFYSLAVTRQREIEETGNKPGGESPGWIRYFAGAVTIGTLVVFFLVAVKERRELHLHPRSPSPPIAAEITPEAEAEATTDIPGEPQN
jgi:arginine:agmatine antiporter